MKNRAAVTEAAAAAHSDGQNDRKKGLEPVGADQNEGRAPAVAPRAKHVDEQLDGEEGAEEDVDGAEERQHVRLGDLAELRLEDAAEEVEEDGAGHDGAHELVVVQVARVLLPHLELTALRRALVLGLVDAALDFVDPVVAILGADDAHEVRSSHRAVVGLDFETESFCLLLMKVHYHRNTAIFCRLAWHGTHDIS